MNAPLLTIMDVVADRTAEEVIGALLVATLGAFALVGLYRRSRPLVANPAALLGGLFIAANLSSMLLGASYVLKHQRESAKSVAADGPFNGYPFRGEPPRPFQPFRDSAAERILAMADQDGDGRTTPEELALAAPMLVASYDPQGLGSIDVKLLKQPGGMWPMAATPPTPQASGPTTEASPAEL